MGCRTHHQTIVRLLGPTRFSGHVQVDKVMDGEDERARTPDRRIKAGAEIHQRTGGAQYACKEHGLQADAARAKMPGEDAEQVNAGGAR